MRRGFCRCECAYVGAQLATEPTRCERCGGLVDEVASARMEAVYAEARRKLDEWAAAHPDALADTAERIAEQGAVTLALLPGQDEALRRS